jgi:hypothetical protein
LKCPTLLGEELTKLPAAEEKPSYQLGKSIALTTQHGLAKLSHLAISI